MKINSLIYNYFKTIREHIFKKLNPKSLLVQQNFKTYIRNNDDDERKQMFFFYHKIVQLHNIRILQVRIIKP